MILIPLLDLHELAAGKLVALMSRRASRDLYDAHRLLIDPALRQKIDIDRLRLTFVIYGAMNRRDWRTLKIEDIGFDPKELENKLIPVLNHKESQKTSWAIELVNECQKMLSFLLPFSEAEQTFFDRLLDEGEIEPALITKDKELQEKIIIHPGLLWKVRNVKTFKVKK